ncbi:hypothetical protein M422DRAFT_274759 [Sphaerobolus stellatus SS14]|uniref:Uncharacterized protein n=1 Tax=Sphaerobolus stellatus (strain SS14) TaxID=990650 RepID=A0A0C9UH09_SPHS4|nr:hypothetical protein M422DRAFT_274759 [Sphaerobolus stellatus SS14]
MGSVPFTCEDLPLTAPLTNPLISKSKGARVPPHVLTLAPLPFSSIFVTHPPCPRCISDSKLYSQQKYSEAIVMYTTAAQITITRPDWEVSNLIKEELAMVLLNHSAASAILGGFVSALVDVEVIQIKRNWSKGHFRKAKALQSLKDF